MHNEIPSTSAIVRDRPDVDDGLLKVMTNFFGIHQERDENGSTRWTVEVDSTVPGMPSQIAAFDLQTQSWKLSGNISSSGAVLNPSTHIPSAEQNTPRPALSPDGSRSIHSDWTDTLPKTDHVNMLRNVDWSKTPLGPIESWSSTLRLYIHMCVSERRAACIYWGEERIAIYNENFIPLAGISIRQSI